MSPRTGRPKTDNPLSYEVKARVDEETYKRLLDFCKKHQIRVTDVVREGVIKVINEKEKD